jgi:hypothetical protein
VSSPLSILLAACVSAELNGICRAEIALTVGGAAINANADVSINKADFSSQTETTIQVGWSGGGHIKPSTFTYFSLPLYVF